MKFNLNDYKNIWFTSDLHLGHNKDFLYSPRGCSSRDEHVNMIIDGINSQAGPADLIFHCGDMCLSSTFKEFMSWVMEIKCNNVYSIIGNHESNFSKLITNQQLRHVPSELWGYMESDKQYCGMGPQQEITIIEPSGIMGQKAYRYPITLNHYPMQLWNKSHHGSWHLCGHLHGSFAETAIDYPHYKRFDCGVENGLKYKEIGEGFMFHWEDVKVIMSEKSIFNGDHHNKDTT